MFECLVTAGHKTSPLALRDLAHEHGSAWKRLRFIAEPGA